MTNITDDLKTIARKPLGELRESLLNYIEKLQKRKRFEP